MKDAREDLFSNFKESIDEQKSSNEEKQLTDSFNNDWDKSIMKSEQKKQEIRKKRKHEKKRKSSNEKMSSSTNQSRSFRWMISFSMSRTSDAFFFDDNEISEFLNKYEDFCDDYELKDNEKKRKFSKYCDFINDQYVCSIINTTFSWREIVRILKKKFWDRDIL